MSPGTQVRLRRTETGGEPAAMVATWMMGELLHIPGLTVHLEHPDVITLKTLSPEDHAAIRSRIATLLGEPRFARWIVLDS